MSESGDMIWQQIVDAVRKLDEMYPPGSRARLFKMSAETLFFIAEQLVAEDELGPSLSLAPSLMGIPVKPVEWMPLGSYYVEFDDGHSEMGVIQEA